MPSNCRGKRKIKTYNLNNGKTVQFAVLEAKKKKIIGREVIMSALLPLTDRPLLFPSLVTS